MAKSVFRDGDLVSGAVLIGLGVFIVSEARNWDYLTPEGPGPGFFPMWYGLALVVLSLAVVVSALARRAHTPQGDIDWRRVGRALVVWLALTVCIAALKVLGFVIGFALLTLFIVSVMYGRRLAFGILSGVATAAVFYLVFPVALNVALPVGIFGF
jgi:putative tricarboxylic transport membrane protein